MREKMGFHLHQALKSLCFNTQWKYAIFWKLERRARLVLTWEDMYYSNHDQQRSSEDRSLSKTLEILHEGHFLHDPLGLAVAKMSYHVFSPGEGIVGQVAVTGRYRWIFSDNQMMDSCSSVECFDEWQAQFSAGIRTIAVVAVVPHGVVQLGSMDKVTEDLKLVTHIKECFLALQDTSVVNISDRKRCSSSSSLPLPDMPMQGETLAVSHDKQQNKDKDKDEKKDGIIKKEELNQRLPLLAHPRKHANNPQGVVLPIIDQREAIEGLSACEGLQSSQHKCDGRIELVHSRSELANLETQKQGQMRLWNHGKCERVTSSQHAGVGSGCQYTSYQSNVFENINLCNFILPANSSRVGSQCFPLDALESASYAEKSLNSERSHQEPELYGCVHSDVQLQEDMNSMDFQTELSCKDALNMSLTFSAGFELLEALGPSFLKHNNYQDWHMEESEVGPTMEMSPGIGCSRLAAESGSEDLLEAVVANACLSGLDSKSERSFCKSAESLLTYDKTPERSTHSKLARSSASCSMDRSSFCLVSDIRSSKALSSRSSSMCSERLDKPLEPGKMNKKRSRPGENPRPRPRDRQLIQDRIKELRELVPNGSKCSIDSLLERTIKHMLFLQSITRHAEKLNKCAESRLHDKEAGLLGSSSFEQGSSWAMEVGTDLKVHSIVVENLNMNGQMLIEPCSRDSRSNQELGFDNLERNYRA